MLGDSWTAGTKVRGDLTDSEPIVTQESKDLSASGISDGTDLRPFEVGSFPSSGGHANGVPTPDKMGSTDTANELLPVKDVDRDQIRLLARLSHFARV